MYELAVRFGIPELTPAPDRFAALCSSIISQQLSTKAADTIEARFLELFPSGLSPESLLKVNPKALRACGLSNSKVTYVRNIAEHVLSGSLELSRMDELDDETVIRELVAVKGVGRWTAEMFLIFTLARQDVFSYGDLGLRRAIQRQYRLPEEQLIPLYLEPIVTPWKPYRSYASRLLWRSLSP